MIRASKKTVGKRILPLLLAVALLLASLPATAFAAGLTAVVTAETMAVYADSGLSRQVGTLAAGEVVSVGHYYNGVAYFCYLDTGGVGYARTADMQPVSNIADITRIQREGTRIYREMDTSSQYKQLRAGAGVYVLSTNGEWAHVACDGLGGYIRTGDLGGNATTPTPTQQAPQDGLTGFTRVDMAATTLADMLTVYTSPSETAFMVGPPGQRHAGARHLCEQGLGIPHHRGPQRLCTPALPAARRQCARQRPRRHLPGADPCL